MDYKAILKQARKQAKTSVERKRLDGLIEYIDGLEFRVGEAEMGVEIDEEVLEAMRARRDELTETLESARGDVKDIIGLIGKTDDDDLLFVAESALDAIENVIGLEGQ